MRLLQRQKQEVFPLWVGVEKDGGAFNGPSGHFFLQLKIFTLIRTLDLLGAYM